MNEPKPFASLSSTLLARKGHAKPAMRPQGFGQGFGYEDLGWNDMGHPPAPERPAVAEASPDDVQPAPPPVVRLQADMAEELGVASEAEPLELTAPVIPIKKAVDLTASPVTVKPVTVKPVSRAAPGARHKAAFTLRLDPDRHLKLRLACALNHRSAQMIVIEALDALLDAMPELDEVAAGVAAKRGARN